MRALLVGFALALAACQPAPPSAAPPAAAQTAPAPATDTPPAPSAALALDSEGLRLVDPGTGRSRLLSFGETDDDALVEILTGVLGPPVGSAVNAECFAVPLEVVRWPGGLSTLSGAGRFTGWAVDGRDGGAGRFATMSGVGPGATRAEAEASVVLEVFESTLGTEFSAGGLTGLLDGDGPDARITALWAGTSCVFR